MKPIRQAVIFVGGTGTRLRPLTLTTPKPMIPIHGKPFLAYIIDILKKNGIVEVILLVGYLHEKIENYFGDGNKFGLTIRYSYSPVKSDTGTRIKKALQGFDKNILLLYGDNYWPLQLDHLTQFYALMHKKAVVTVYSNRDKATKNNMYVDATGLVRIYDRSRKKRNLNGVDIGFFLLDISIFKNLPEENFSFEDVVIPKLIKGTQLAGYFTDNKYYGLSTPERIPSIEAYFRPRKVIFLDRDGVINKRPAKAEYISTWKEFIFLPKVLDALHQLIKKGYEIYIVTNQAGIARKKVTRKQVERIHTRLTSELKKLGITLSDILICPHGWNEGCFCRKPNPGLFFQAASLHYINLTESICVGDDPRDILAGRRAGCKTIFVGNTLSQFTSEYRPDAHYKDLYEAAINL